MKSLIFILLFTNLYFLRSEDNFKDSSFMFYDYSAISKPKNTFKCNLFTKSEYSFSDNLSITAHPILMFVSPVIDLKYNFYSEDNLNISSIHGINYPTILMNLIKGKGAGGFISPEFSIPQMIAFKNSIIATYSMKDIYLTGNLGFEFALNNSELEPGSSIDLPLVLPRMMVFYKDIGLFLDLIAEGIIDSNFDFYIRNSYFLFPSGGDRYDYEYQKTNNNFFLEISSLGFWKINQSFKAGFGATLCYGNYPFGLQWHLIPTFDLTFKI